MRALIVFAAVAAFAVVTTRPAAGYRLPASSVRRPADGVRDSAAVLRPPSSGASGLPAEARSAKAGAIRGHVDARVGPSADVRPDPAMLGMGTPRDALDRRRSVVYLESAPRGAFDVPPDRHARMDQRNERFVPHVLAITAGTWVDFPNDDRIYHNVFSLSKTREFNLGRYPQGHSKSVQFADPGVVRVFCEIHSHMSGFILVLAHRFFAVTDDEGRYRIDGVPAGTYNLLVWNEAIHGDPPKRSVTVESGDVEADFTIK
jgi:plastocyanin